MDTERLRFLFGPDVDPSREDLDDVDVRGRLLAASFAHPLSPEQAFMGEAVCSQMYSDDPPEVWATAQRLLGAGLDRDRVFSQLSLALAQSVSRSLGGGEFDRVGYCRDLASLPLPGREEVEGAAVAITRAVPGIGADDLHDRVLDQVGAVGDDRAAVGIVDRVLDHLMGPDGPLALLAGDAVVHVADLTSGIVLTHRLTDVELAAGELAVSFDLAGFARHETLSLTDGRPLEALNAGWGRQCWAGPDGWLAGLGPGDLVAVRVSPDGVVDLDPVALASSPPPALVARVEAVYRAELEGPGLPVRGEDLLLGLLLGDRSTFDAPQAPLDELCSAAGLERRRDEVADDESVWFQAEVVKRVRRVSDRADDRSGTARTVLGVLRLADLVSGVDPAWLGPGVTLADRAALRASLADLAASGSVFNLVAFELFDGLEDHRPERALGFVEALLDAADRPSEHGMARLLACLRAEREGDPVAAEAHCEAGLGDDPGNPMLVDRLAWYASDRGDAPRAARLWRSLGANHGLEADLAEVERASSAMAQPGRNEPCWCGSGRKYKHCHLGVTGLEPLPERVGWLCRKAVAFMERRGGSAMEDAWEIATARADYDEDAAEAVFSDPIVMDLTLTEGRWFDEFVRERGPLLPDDEALLAQAWLLVPRTVYEMVDVRPGEGIDLRDLRTGDRVAVRERTFSQQAQRGGLVCGRAVPDGDGHQFIGGLFPVAPGSETDLLDLLDEGDPVDIAEHVAGLYRLPELRNREGEELVECEVTLDVPDPVAAWAFLDKTYEPDEEGPGSWSELHPLSADERILRATFGLSGSRLTISANSAERADRAVAAMRAALPGARVVADHRVPFDAEAIARQAARRRAEGELAPSGGEAVPPEALEEIADHIERRWCDENVPALGGLTPRQAAADPTRREALARLIDSFPAGPPVPGTIVMRPDRLRALLGL